MELTPLIGWRMVTWALAAGALGLLAGCGTFEVHGQLVTPTSSRTIIPTKTPIPLTPSPTEIRATDLIETPTSAQLDVPHLDDAQIIVDIDSRLIYRSSADLDSAMEFYETQMPQNGWTQVSATRGETNALYTFSRDDESVTIVIVEDWLGLNIEVQRQE